MPAVKKLLIIEDSSSLAITYQAYLRYSDFEVEWVDNLSDARLILETETPDLILLDLELPDGNGIDLLKSIRSAGLATQVVIMTAYGSSDIAEQAIRYGAFDYLTKPFNANRLLVTLKNAERNGELNQKIEEFSSVASFHSDLLGASVAMQEVFKSIPRLAKSSACVLLVGEAGVGKKSVAKAIHDQSKRAGHALKFIQITENDQETEQRLFGLVSGGASDLPGALKDADGSTLVVSGLCKFSSSLLVRILEFMRTGCFCPVGTSKQETADVRLIFVSNHSLTDQVEHGRLTEEFCNLLHEQTVCVPSLRDRDDDVLLIARQLLLSASSIASKSFTGLSKSTEILFKNYQWQGNVTELKQCIGYIVENYDSDLVTEEMLPKSVRTNAFSCEQLPDQKRYISGENEFDIALEGNPGSKIEPLWQTEKRAIQNAIDACDGNVTKAASLLEVAPSTIYRKLQNWMDGEH